MPKYNINNEFECRNHVLWSNHAIMRAAEYRVDCPALYMAWTQAVEYQLDEDQKQDKFQKYGSRSLGDRYFYHDQTDLVFTVNVAKSGQWFIETVIIGKGNSN